MNVSDEELLAQFAALSSSGDDDVNELVLPQSVVKSWDWENCMVMKVMGARVVFETTFATALRKAWPVHPETVTQGLGNNFFLVEFKNQDDLLQVMAKGTFRCNKDMVVMRLAVGPEDLTDPQINEFECWVELHGIPPESVDHTGIELVFKEVGTPISEYKSFYWAGQKVYKRKLLVDLRQPLKPKLPLKHPQLGRKWIYAVYDNIANVCMFCARIGHEHITCPAKLKLKRMKQEEKHQDELAGKQIKETMVGKWLMDRSYVPRSQGWLRPHQAEGNSSQCKEGNTTEPVLTDVVQVHKKNRTGNEANTSTDRGLKRPIDLNDSRVMMITMGMAGENGDNQHQEVGSLNCKRAKEANPNSPSRFAQ
ncbi:hypothetical protein LUZ62_025141 [Rhynchospora pubera]|uniref:DUF4283 domain-containing protein n=1 Tax=Rhynchospora pubera TaxID=906938 RepID=A0AAV8H7E0_9POAL|nr:hypothetical protein LUZ62_025141 [Rhynchospora pubera]